MVIDKLAAPYKKLFTKVKQLRQRLEKVMNTDHIDLNELSKVRGQKIGFVFQQFIMFLALPLMTT